MNTTPVSWTPRILIKVRMASTARHSCNVWGCKPGAAEMSAPTPAEIPTAAVSV